VQHARVALRLLRRRLDPPEAQCSLCSRGIADLSIGKQFVIDLYRRGRGERRNAIGVRSHMS